MRQQHADVPAQEPGRAATPLVYLDTTLVPSDGRKIEVAAGGDLQAALDSARPGDVISLEAGAVFTGNFILPNKRGEGWITIRSSTDDANLPPEEHRITPEHSAVMPRLETPNTQPVISTEAGAHHYRLIAVEFSLAPDVKINYGLVSLGSGDHTSPDQLPHDI
ncbi:MAG: hypothetical protein ACLGJB_07895, partial [Blastocatellia bacterium]